MERYWDWQLTYGETIRYVQNGHAKQSSSAMVSVETTPSSSRSLTCCFACFLVVILYYKYPTKGTFFPSYLPIFSCENRSKSTLFRHNSLLAEVCGRMKSELASYGTTLRLKANLRWDNKIRTNGHAKWSLSVICHLVIFDSESVKFCLYNYILKTEVSQVKIHKRDLT